MTLRVLVAGPVGFLWTAIHDTLHGPGIEVVGEPTPYVDVGAVLGHRPDVVVIDADEAERWLESVRDLRRLLADTTLVILARSGRREDVVAAVRAGATGYITKDVSSEGFRRSIDGIRRGELAMSRTTAAFALGAFDLDRPSAGRRRLAPQRLETLSKRELEVLALLAEGLKDREVAERLSLSVRTVETHVAQILRRLDVRGRSQAIVRYLEATAPRPD